MTLPRKFELEVPYQLGVEVSSVHDDAMVLSSLQYLSNTLLMEKIAIIESLNP